MQEVLERALKACEAAEVYWAKRTSTPAEFQSNTIKSIKTAEQSGIALRVIKDGKIGFSSTTKAGDVQGLIDAACLSAKYGPPAQYAFPTNSNFAEVHNYDPAVLDMTVDALAEMGESFIGGLTAEYPRLTANLTLEKAVREVVILNSSGLCASHRSSEMSLATMAQLVEGDDFLQAHEVAGSSSAALDIEAPKQRVLAKISNGRKTASLPTGKYPVLVTPLALGDVVARLQSSVSGSSVSGGVSRWRDKLGTQVAGTGFSLYDDQTRSGAIRSCPFDDEGSPRQRLPIIEDGVLRNFLLDLRTASLLGKAPTGNGMRHSIGETPFLDVSTLVIEAGTDSLEAIIRGIRRGAIVDRLIGARMANASSGEVSGNIALGLVVENGEVVGRLKDAMFSMNVFDALREKIIGVSSEQVDSGSTVYPYMLLDGIGITTKG